MFGLFRKAPASPRSAVQPSTVGVPDLSQRPFTRALLRSTTAAGDSIQKEADRVGLRECRIVGARNASIRSSPIPPRWLPARCRHARARLARATGLLPLRQPAGRYGGERDRPAVAPPHTVARTRAETPDAHCAFGEAIARYRASNAANEQHHHGPDDYYKRSGASPGPKAGGPVFRVM
jgi:hypothetical protein